MQMPAKVNLISDHYPERTMSGFDRMVLEVTREYQKSWLAGNTEQIAHFSHRASELRRLVNTLSGLVRQVPSDKILPENRRWVRSWLKQIDGISSRMQCQERYVMSATADDLLELEVAVIVARRVVTLYEFVLKYQMQK
jgi:hypothetical protein